MKLVKPTMKIVFILAPFDQIKADGFNAASLKKPYGYAMPLGIAYLAAMVEQAGHQASVLDPSPSGMSIAQISAWVKQQQPDVIGISTMTHTSSNAFEVAGALKAELPQTPIIVGGSHCNVFPDLVLQECPAIDVVVIGEAEERIMPICEALLTDPAKLKDIQGIIFKTEFTGKPINTGKPCQGAPLDSYPFPARHLFDHSLYTPYPDQLRRFPITSFMSSRGCTWKKCKFCFEGGDFMPLYQRRSPENVVDELIMIKQAGFNGVSIWDDNFTVQPGWINRFVDLMKAHQVDIDFTCFGRVNTITEKMVHGLKQAGCFSIYFGFESGSQQILDAVAKGTTLKQALRAVKMCQKAGIEVRGSFILGMPDDTPELAEITIQFARQLNLDSVKFMLYTPEPGTELYEVAKKKGSIVNQGFQGSLTQACYVPHGYTSREQLEAIARKANRTYLLRPSFIWKKILTIRSLADIRKYYDGFRMVISLK